MQIDYVILLRRHCSEPIAVLNETIVSKNISNINFVVSLNVAPPPISLLCSPGLRSPERVL